MTGGLGRRRRRQLGGTGEHGGGGGGGAGVTALSWQKSVKGAPQF